ncbi:aspartyl-phosphate phosphatase Spo0E family protein [Petroclostridium sp. X23]|uniref:aspartyl-phosphate phosphatase Spo0E family protein n=1 Tax=Petroclostridium sp. X23 TaxID=3045146 RepID=UPI0024ACD9DA|nr:aspartyl-phosphate phosphatase Spo0E family protein [Petroclostridium sp. X23]WHH59881.1 aspartyl-phosphate phosphatase Spo0E family protein [Petroclostridium sp. X23]
MLELEKLLEDIEKLRETLHQLIDKKGLNLQDPEIISASEDLNTAITKYNKFIEKNLNNEKSSE